jgi:four helix bundle protein
MGNFLKLRVWKLGKELAVRIYRLTQTSAFSKDYGLKDQIQRSAVSIPSNIAEGDDLETDKQSVRHFYIAKGSTAELLTQLIIAHEIGYIDTDTSDSLVNDCKIISVMLTKLIKARSH